MAQGKDKKYIRMLVSIPDTIWFEFKKLVPTGSRSQIISEMMKQYISKKKPEAAKKSFWNDIGKHIKGDYSHEDPKKMIKDAWKNVD